MNDWYTDKNGVARLGIQYEKKKSFYTDGGHYKTIWYRKPSEEKFKKLHQRKIGIGNTFDVIGFDESYTKAYVFSDKESGFTSLWVYDIEKGILEKKVFGTDSYDLSSALINKEGKIIGVKWYEDFQQHHYFNEKDETLFNKMKKQLPGYQISITSMSKSREQIIVYLVNDNTPGKYAWFDFKANKGGMWYSQHPKLEKKGLPHVKPIQFTASDGLIIPGYLTLPNTTGDKKPPLIVMPHGGPHSRDDQRFDRLLQFIVNRGYAVLQINFRGSSGFGTAYKSKGYLQWGKLMQRDVIEATHWVHKQGVVSDDACIVGWSYGGYVALTAAFQTPDQFKCIISIAGISDLKKMVKDDKSYDEFTDYVVADNTDDDAMDDLDNYSAMYAIEKIVAPILLIHDKNDGSVNYRQSKYFVSSNWIKVKI